MLGRCCKTATLPSAAARPPASPRPQLPPRLALPRQQPSSTRLHAFDGSSLANLAVVAEIGFDELSVRQHTAVIVSTRPFTGTTARRCWRPKQLALQYHAANCLHCSLSSIATSVRSQCRLPVYRPVCCWISPHTAVAPCPLPRRPQPACLAARTRGWCCLPPCCSQPSAWAATCGAAWPQRRSVLSWRWRCGESRRQGPACIPTLPFVHVQWWLS